MGAGEDRLACRRAQSRLTKISEQIKLHETGKSRGRKLRKWMGDRGALIEWSPWRYAAEGGALMGGLRVAVLVQV